MNENGNVHRREGGTFCNEGSASCWADCHYNNERDASDIFR